MIDGFAVWRSSRLPGGGFDSRSRGPMPIRGCPSDIGSGGTVQPEPALRLAWDGSAVPSAIVLGPIQFGLLKDRAYLNSWCIMLPSEIRKTLSYKKLSQFTRSRVALVYAAWITIDSSLFPSRSAKGNVP